MMASEKTPEKVGNNIPTHVKCQAAILSSNNLFQHVVIQEKLV